MTKVKQKLSDWFRAKDDAHAYCRISSYLQTMANRGYNPLIAIHMALAGIAYLVFWLRMSEHIESMLPFYAFSALRMINSGPPAAR